MNGGELQSQIPVTEIALNGTIIVLNKHRSSVIKIAHFTVVCLVIWPWLKVRLVLTLF